VFSRSQRGLLFSFVSQLCIDTWDTAITPPGNAIFACACESSRLELPKIAHPRRKKARGKVQQLCARNEVFPARTPPEIARCAGLIILPKRSSTTVDAGRNCARTSDLPVANCWHPARAWRQIVESRSAEWSALKGSPHVYRHPVLLGPDDGLPGS
jgi:hypothetical protein